MTFKGIENTIQELFADANEWCEKDWRHYYWMMIDTSDARIWLEKFVSSESWVNFESETVHRLGSRYRDDCSELSDEKIFVEDAIAFLKEAGWEII